MSYSISLNDSDGAPVKVPPHTEGSIIQLGGCSSANFDVTYNYSRYYYQTLCADRGIRKLSGMKAADAIPLLEVAIQVLGTEQSGDYWEVTPGNAGHALNVMLEWAKRYPDATFEVY